MALKDNFEEITKVIGIKLLTSIVVGSVITYVAVNNQSKENEEAPDVAESDIHEHRPLNNYKKTRRPSSLSSTNRKDSATYKPTAKITSYDGSNFVEPDSFGSTEQSNSGYNANSSSYQSLFSNTPTSYPLIREEARNENLASKKSNTKTAAEDQIFLGSGTSRNDKKLEVKKEIIPTTNSSSSSSASSSTPVANSCSTNIVGGSFGNPVGITLACIYPSTIKYCLAVDTCCDPESGGTTYGSQVVIGPINGNYCLSYIGDSETGGNSIVYQQNYTINSTFPNLTVGHSKIFYQTTELIGTSFISSLDFGQANHSVGQINLKAHDPGPADLNYNCDEIIANYVTLPSPIPITVLALFDVGPLSLASPSSQVDIPLRLDQLDYGDNFITSYIENNSFVAPLYSCSTTKVNLDDFEYFQSDISQGEPGDNSVREFEGEFSSYGFFEKNIEVSRGPAGVNTEENTGENLKSGIYGMFY